MQAEVDWKGTDKGRRAEGEGYLDIKAAELSRMAVMTLDATLELGLGEEGNVTRAIELLEQVCCLYR